MQDGALVEISGVSKLFSSRRVLSDINLVIRRGNFIVLTGPNGGGKTTLLRLILGLLEPSAGTISVSQELLDSPPGYLPQKTSIDSHYPISVREVVEMPLLMDSTDAAVKRQAMEKALTTMGISHLAPRPIGLLSGGQLQRVLMARAIVNDPLLLVMDEPLSYLDRTATENFISLLAALKEKGTTIILVTHQPEYFSTLATHSYYIDLTLSSSL